MGRVMADAAITKIDYIALVDPETLRDVDPIDGPAIALLAGFIIFPAGFSIPGFDPSASGPGLIFTVLPQLFATLPGGSEVESTCTPST